MFLTRTETLTENSESAASEQPEKRIPLSSDAEKQEHDRSHVPVSLRLRTKEVSYRNGLLNFPGFLSMIKLATYLHSVVTFVVKLVRTTPIIDML